MTCIGDRFSDPSNKDGYSGISTSIPSAIWLGRDDNKSSRLTGSSGALQIWIDIMQGLKPQPLSFITSEGIEWAKILHDQRVPDGCSAAVAYPFVKAYLPEISGTCQNTLIQRKRVKSIKTERKDEKNEPDIRKHFNIH